MFESIRKFGLEYCDLPNMLSNVSYFLRFMTLNVDERWTKGIPIYFYILSAVVSICYFYVYFVSMLWFVFYRCKETGDLLSAIIVLSLGISSEIGTVKFIFISLNIKKIRQIVSECLACDALVEPNTRFSNNLLGTLKLVKKRAMIFWIVVILNGILYITKPFFMPGRHFMEDVYVLYGLEPMYKSPNYEIAYLLFSIGSTFTVYLPANITAFFLIVTGYSEAQMFAWTAELRHLWTDANQNYDQHIYEDNHSLSVIQISEKHSIVLNMYIRERLIVIAKGHATNINLLHHIEDAFRGGIAGEFFLLVMGLIAMLLGGLERTWIEMSFALSQVAMDCFSGQRIIDASDSFEKAVYDCKWENFDKTNMKIVLLILQNAQKTMTLSAGGITVLSFVSLMSIIRSVYSAYTTLEATMK